jgi:hypothetical protein
MRVEDVFKSCGIVTSDAAFRVACGTCTALNSFDNCEVKEDGERTLYLCPKCDSVLFMVGPSAAMAGGFRIGDYLVQPMGEMWMGGWDAAG